MLALQEQVTKNETADRPTCGGKPFWFVPLDACKAVEALRKVLGHAHVTSNWLRRLTAADAIIHGNTDRVAAKQGHTAVTATTAYAAHVLPAGPPSPMGLPSSSAGPSGYAPSFSR